MAVFVLNSLLVLLSWAPHKFRDSGGPAPQQCSGGRLGAKYILREQISGASLGWAF